MLERRDARVIFSRKNKDVLPDMSRLATFIVLVLTVAAAVSIARGEGFDDALVTDRPDFTESSSVVPRCRLQIETGYTYLHDESAGVSVDEHVLPEMLLRYGLTDCLELRVVWVGFVSSTERDRLTGLTDQTDGGTGLDIGIKRQFTDQDGWLPESGVIVGITAPVGDPEVGTTQLGASAVGLYSWQINDRLSVAGNTGCFFASPGGDYYNLFTQSVSAAVSLTDRLGMYHEWFVLAFDGAEDSRPRHFYNGGVTYLVTPDLQLDWRAGVGLTEASGDFFTGAGFSARW